MRGKREEVRGYWLWVTDFRFQISGYGGGCEGCKCVECVKLGEKDGENWKAVFFLLLLF